MEDIIEKTHKYIKSKLEGEGSGHDYWHIYRVWQNAKKIGMKENANIYIVELAALLHDIADWKFNDGDDKAGGKTAGEWLNGLNVDKSIISSVVDIIDNISYKGANVSNTILSLDGMVVQDADRLDAIGAIGIARAFAYGGFKNREIYNPNIKPVLHDSFESYKKNQSHTINHFYEKLLLLKDKLNTDTARIMAVKRHKFMEEFLDEFYSEWNSN